MKILFSAIHYPDPNANTTCCENLAYYFKSQGHDVDFLVIKQPNQSNFEIVNGFDVFRVEPKEKSFYYTHFSSFSAKNSNNWSIYSNIDMNLLIKKQNVKFKAYPPTLLISFFLDVDDACQKLKNANKHYDYTFAFCTPYTCLTLAYVLKKKKITDHWAAVMLDAFIFNKCLPESESYYRKRVIENIFTTADRIFLVKGILEEYPLHSYKPEFLNRTTEIAIPIMKEPQTFGAENFNDIPTLVYAGMFYWNIRNPEKMLEILSKIIKTKIKIFSCHCEDIFERKKELFTESELCLSGRISHDQCLKEFENADFLINLGNAISNQTPSKILEYISFGKPIIHFYFNEDDTCLPILKNYPLSICVNVEHYSDADIQNINDFILKNKGKKITFDEATKNLKTYRIDYIGDLMQKVTLNKI